MVTAFLAVAVLLTVRSGGRGDSPGASPTPTTAADTDLVPVVADLVRRTGGAAEIAADKLVVEGPNASALLSFPSADVDLACVQRAQLVVTQLSGRGLLGVWVSLETEAAMLPDGADLGRIVIAYESPSVSAGSAPPGGQVTWDVLPLLRWQQAHQPGSHAVVLVVKPRRSQDLGQPSFGAQLAFAALESGDRAILRLTRSPACEPEAAGGLPR